MAGFDLVTQADNPTPQLPGQLQIKTPAVQPGNQVAAAPIIPSAAPPNVDGGQASFSSMTKSIQDLVSAKTAELSASSDALKANASVDNSASTQISGISQNTQQAYQNLQKAQSLPGGAQGKLSQIIGLFDSDYNAGYQATQIKINETKANQISATAAALKEQNNALPALMGKVSEAQKIIFDAQTQANDLTLKQQTLTDQQMKTKIEAQRLRIEMSQEGRASAEFGVRSLTTAQLQAVLPQAQAGKGKFAGLGGLIEDRLTSEKSAETALGIANNNLQKGNRDEYNNSMVDAISHMPSDIVAAKLGDAQTKGMPVVEFPSGQTDPKTKQPVMLQVPFNLVQQGLVQSLQVQGQVNTALAADYTQRLNIIPNATNIMNVGNAFASVDPRATQIVTNLGNVMKGMNAKDPNSVRQTGILLGDQKTAMDNIVKENAAKYSTPEAKAAVIAYGGSGKFDAGGGAAVMADSTGIPALSTQSRYRGMWQSLATQVATEISKQHLVQSTPTMQGGQADAMSLIAMMQAKPQGKETLNRITTNILADPNKVKPLADAIKGTIQGKSIQNVLGSLTQQKNADPFWNQVLSHPENFKTQGRPDASKLFGAMETATVASHGKVNYADQFLSALQNYAINADNAASSDASYTVQDHAAEAAIFGGSPQSAVLGDLHYKLRQISQRANQEMQQRIKDDVSGKTQRDAVNATQGPTSNALYDNFTGPAGILTDIIAKKIFGKTGVDVNSVPSATGTGMTAAQVKAIYGGGQQGGQ